MKYLKFLLLVACFFSTQIAWTQLKWQPTNGPEGGATWYIYHNDKYAFYPTQDFFYRTADGITWEQLPHANLWPIGAGKSIVAAFKDFGWGVTPDAIQKFVISYDNGKTFVERNMPPKRYNDNIAVCSQGIFVAHGNAGKLYRTTNEGQTWDSLQAPELYCYNILASDDRLFTGGGKKMWRLRADGVSWELISPSSGVDDSFYNVFADGDNLYLSAETSLWASRNNGLTWKKTTIPFSNQKGNFVKIGNRIYKEAGGVNLMYTDNFGDTWQSYPVSNIESLSGLARVGTTLLAATYGKGALSLDTNLKEWKTANKGLNAAAVYDIAITGQKLWAAAGNGVFSYNLNTQTWNRDNILPLPKQHYSIVSASPAGVLATYSWASAEVMISTNAGAGWEKRPFGFFMSGINGIVKYLYWIGENLYAVTDFSNPSILRSVDYGKTWQMLDNGIAGFVRFNNAYYGVARWTSKINVTQDFGNTWREIPSPNGLNVSELYSTGDRLFALAGGQSRRTHQLYTTTDGQKWFFANYGLPNLGESVIPVIDREQNVTISRDRSKYLLQKEDFGMYVSLDSCKTWLPAAKHTGKVVVHEGSLYTPSFGRGVLKAGFPDNYGAVSTGIVFIDDNGDGVKNPGELNLPNTRLEIRAPDPVYGFSFTQTDQSGRYNIGTYTGSLDTIRPRIFSSYISAIRPPFRVVSNSGSDRNFAVQFTRNITDGKVVHAGTGVPRPGFDYSVVVSFENLGTIPLDGQIGVKLDPKFIFGSAQPAPTAKIGSDSLVWNLSRLGLFAAQQIKITGKVSQNAPLGNVLQTTSSMTTTGKDVNLANNFCITRDTIRGSYDPNEKKVVPERGLAKSEISARKPLIYTIFFQNVGTFEAERVRIADQLDTALNWQTLRFLQASHKVSHFSLRTDGMLEVIFDKIALPDSKSNEAASHGFVQFSIERNMPFNPNRRVDNKAAIYFDFNAPIITNTVSIGVPVSTVSIQEPNNQTEQRWLQIAPNPAQHTSQVYSAGFLEGKGTLQVTNASGQFCQQESVSNCAIPLTLNISGLANGVYWVRMFNAQGNMVGKLLVQRD